MSGGALNYFYSRLEYDVCGKMEDDFMNEFMKDLVPVMKALEWWQSADWDEEVYREELEKLKDKYFREGSTAKEKIINDIKNECIERIKAI